MNTAIFGISTFVFIMAGTVVNLIIGPTLVKLFDIALPRGARVLVVWLHRATTARPG